MSQWDFQMALVAKDSPIGHWGWLRWLMIDPTVSCFPKLKGYVCFQDLLLKNQQRVWNFMDFHTAGTTPASQTLPLCCWLYHIHIAYGSKLRKHLKNQIRPKPYPQQVTTSIIWIWIQCFSPFPAALQGSSLICWIAPAIRMVPHHLKKHVDLIQLYL